MPDHQEAQMREEVERFERNGGRWEYQGYTAEDSQALVTYLMTTLAENPGARIRVVRGMRPQGQITLWHNVYDATGTLLGSYNQSWPCPPCCPDCT